MRSRQRVIDAGESPTDVRAPRAIFCDAVAIPSDRVSSPQSTRPRRPIRTAADVDAALAAGDAVLAPPSLQLREYWSYAVRLDLMLDFVQAQRPAVLHHRLCDLRFRGFIAPEGRPPPAFRVDSWLYYYEDAHYDGAPAEAAPGVVAALDAARDSSSSSGHGRHCHRAESASDRAWAARSGVSLEVVTHMRRLGETGFVIGFDGPKLGLWRPRGEIREAAVALMLKAVQQPRVHRDSDAAARAAAAPPPTEWETMEPAARTRHLQLAREMADELIDEAHALFGDGGGSHESGGRADRLKAGPSAPAHVAEAPGESAPPSNAPLELEAAPPTARIAPAATCVRAALVQTGCVQTFRVRTLSAARQV